LHGHRPTTGASAHHNDWPCIAPTTRLGVPRYPATKEADATWLDPRTGESVAIGKVPSEDVAEFTTPDGWEDALLVLE
jgi:hypothetical protein